MFYYNARWSFALEVTPDPIPGSIIASSCVSAVDLRKRKFSDHGHLATRLLDPQLYMAGLDPAIQPTVVERLASYPWFHGQDVPQYDSGEYRNPTEWKKKHGKELLAKWTRAVPKTSAAIKRSARAAVEMQQAIGCSSIVLAGPLTTIADQTFESELAWIDAGLAACAEFRVAEPVYATVALSEAVMHNVPPTENQVIHTISNQIAARPELAGAYIVFEQADQGSYVWTSKDPLMCLMLLVDDLVRGAGKDAIVNCFGSFGAVAVAAGASVWSSGYLLSQRRLSLRAKSGRMRPRYYSLSLAGDVGIATDLERVRDLDLANEILTPTDADQPLRRALAAGRGPSAVAPWQYKIGNKAAAQAHYMEIMARFGAKLASMKRADAIRAVEEWLNRSVALASLLIEKGFGASGQTDIVHQKVWLDVFRAWKAHTKQ